VLDKPTSREQGVINSYQMQNEFEKKSEMQANKKAEAKKKKREREEIKEQEVDFNSGFDHGFDRFATY